MRGRSVPRRGRHDAVPEGTTLIRDARATPIAAGARFIRPRIERRGAPRYRGCRCTPRAVLAGHRREDVVRQRRDPDRCAIWTRGCFFHIALRTPSGGIAKVTLRHFRCPVAGCESHSPTLSPSGGELESHSPTLSPSGDERESHSPTLSRGVPEAFFIQ